MKSLNNYIIALNGHMAFSVDVDDEIYCTKTYDKYIVSAIDKETKLIWIRREHSREYISYSSGMLAFIFNKASI